MVKTDDMELLMEYMRREMDAVKAMFREETAE